MRVLVTGGAGYVGSVVSSQAIEAGHEVCVLDDLSKGHEGAVAAGAELVRQDLLDKQGLLRVVSGGGFDGVLHFAARSLVGESVKHPGRYYECNLVGTLNLLEAMRESGVSRMVFSSTAAVYGAPGDGLIEEDAPTVPTNPYGGAKLAADGLIGFYSAAHGMATTSLRYFNVAGASGALGEDHEPETHLIPLVLDAAAGRRGEIEIFGMDYPTPDGTAIRDYIHVEDLGRAHLLALGAATAGEHRVYNLGNGTGFSVREVVEAAQRVTGRRIRTVEGPRRTGDPAVLVASSEKIRMELGWRPFKTTLEEMIGDAWAWSEAHPYGYVRVPST